MNEKELAKHKAIKESMMVSGIPSKYSKTDVVTLGKLMESKDTKVSIAAKQLMALLDDNTISSLSSIPDVDLFYTFARAAVVKKKTIAVTTIPSYDEVRVQWMNNFDPESGTMKWFLRTKEVGYIFIRTDSPITQDQFSTPAVANWFRNHLLSMIYEEEVNLVFLGEPVLKDDSWAKPLVKAIAPKLNYL